jgi:hypothetical protein
LCGCNLACRVPKSPRSCAIPLSTGCLHFAILGGGVPARSRVFSPQVLDDLEPKIFRLSPEFSTMPDGPGWGWRGRAGCEAADGGAGRVEIGPPGRDPEGGRRGGGPTGGATWSHRDTRFPGDSGGSRGHWLCRGRGAPRGGIAGRPASATGPLEVPGPRLWSGTERWSAAESCCRGRQ